MKIIAEGFEPGEFEVEVNADQITEVELGLKRFVGYEDEIIYDDGTAENALVLNECTKWISSKIYPKSIWKSKRCKHLFLGHRLANSRRK